MIVDSNVIVDLLDHDSEFAAPSLAAFSRWRAINVIIVNEVIFAEVGGRFANAAETLRDLEFLGVKLMRLTLDECHRAGIAFREYRRRGAPRTSILPDFLIGAQAAIRGWPILTRDAKRFASYFPEVTLIDPTQAAE